MSPVMTLQEVAELLNKKDVRSAVKWCEKNDVEIFLDEVSNRKYVLKAQVEYEKYKKIIRYLKSKYKEKWIDALNIYLEMDMLKIIHWEEDEKFFRNDVNSSYRINGEIEQAFYQHLTGNINELK